MNYWFIFHPYFFLIYFLLSWFWYTLCNETQVPYYKRLLYSKIVIYEVCYLYTVHINYSLHIMHNNFFGSIVTPTVIKIIKEFFLYACLTAYDPLNFKPGQCSVSWIC